MTTSSRRSGLLAFVGAAIALFFVADLATDVAARMSIGGEAVAAAALDHLRLAGQQLAGTVFLSLPFVGLAFIAWPLVRTRGRWAGVVFLLLGAVALGGVSFVGYQQSALALQGRHWTGAALAIAFIPFMSLPLLLVAFLIRRFALRVRAPGHH